MNRRNYYCMIAFALFCTLSGCVNEQTDGTTKRFSYELWVSLTLLIGGAAAAFGGWTIRESSARFGWGLLIMGTLAAIGGAPSMFLEVSVVSEKSFTIRSGIWGMTACHDVEIDKIQKISITSEEVRGRRGSTKTNYYLLCQLKDGTTSKLGINNDVTEKAGGYFLSVADEQGIPIDNQL